MSLVQEQEYNGLIFKPYGMRSEVGDCADVNGARDVSKIAYGKETSFVVANRLIVKHAP